MARLSELSQIIHLLITNLERDKIMKSQKNNSEDSTIRKNKIIAILLFVVVLVWLVVFFFYAVAFSDMLYNYYGTYIIIGTTMLIVFLVAFIAKQRYDYDKVIEEKNKQIQDLITCCTGALSTVQEANDFIDCLVKNDFQLLKFISNYTEASIIIQESCKFIDELQTWKDGMCSIDSKNIKAVIEKTTSDLHKILSKDSLV
jgi:magnesium-transporting ATPase (P-type)